MGQLEVKVKQEVVDYIERLQFEVMARQDVITSLLEIHSKDATADILEGEVFRAYFCQLSEAKAGYEYAKRQLEDEYVPKGLQGHKYSWGLDFSSNTLTIHKLCNCQEGEDEETA